MKKMLLFCCLGIGFSAFAEAIEATYISRHTVNNCASWNFVQTSTSSGYVCSHFPSSIQVPDHFSLQNAIHILERRIQALENQVREYEGEALE